MFVMILNQYTELMKKYIEVDSKYLYDLHNGGKTFREIEKLTGYSFFKIQKEINSYEYNKKISDRYKEIEDKFLVAVCKITKKEFIDYKNTSGAITTHLFDTYNNFKVDTNYKRKSFEYKNFKYWYDEYFDFIYKDIINTPIKQCKYCDWNTIDIENKSGSYMNHINITHNIETDDYLRDYPDDLIYFKKEKNKIEREKIFENKDNLITCKICNKKLKHINNTHLNKHNITVLEYKEIYGEQNLMSKNTKDLYIENRKNNFQPTGNFTKRSNAEKEIIEILEQYNVNLKITDRTILNGLECDILIEDSKLLIEFNGVYYHSELNGKKDNKYHLNKLEIANSKGYSMIQIFEDEWLFNKEIIINKILHILKIKIPEKTIFGRKCDIRLIYDSKIKNNFLLKNHIQGPDKSNIHYGAYYNNELVAVMTFDNKRNMSIRNNNINNYELKRFSTKINYNVIGIGGKLFKYFLRNHNPENVISFADLRWTLNKDNNLYTKLGFKLNKTLSPDYTYIKYSGIYKNKRLHKFAYGKKRLKTLFPEIYSDNKTEWEIMQEAGYDRIWDCGKLKYVYDCTPI